MKKPVVSVILPAYNGPKYIAEAVESILAQTFGDFELIIIDDGSTDETPHIVRGYTDPRIQLISQANMGLAGALNRGIGLARGSYIARQDQDDRSFPDRLRKQVAFLDAHPTCALVGTWAEIWRETRKTPRTHAHPTDNAELKYLLLLNNPFVHSSAMLRKSALVELGGYSTDSMRQPPEDYELWSRISRRYDVANIPDTLHVYREVDGSMSRGVPSPFIDHLVTIAAENIAWAAGVDHDDPNVVNIAALEHGAPHRLQGEPDFSAMRAVFGRAAASVTGNDTMRFVKDAERHIEALADRRANRLARRLRRRLIRAGRCVAGLNR